MIKELVVVAMPLLNHDALEAIQYTQPILDFTMLGQYVLHDNKTLCYMEHSLYRLKSTKIVFEHHRPINCKLY